MTASFLHGVEVLELDTGIRPIRTVRSAVIGIIGTAPQADAAVYPLNTPVLVAGNRTMAGQLGQTGTLPSAMDGIFDQIGATVVVVRVDEGADEAHDLQHRRQLHRLHRCSRLHGSRVRRRIFRRLDRPGYTHQRAEDTANPGTIC